MEETTTKQQHSTGREVKGDMTFDEQVIQKIVKMVIEQVDGLLTVSNSLFSKVADKTTDQEEMAGIKTEVGKKEVAVDLDVVIEYGADVPKLATETKQLIYDEVKQVTGLEVIEVNLHVADILSTEEYQKEQTDGQQADSNKRTIQEEAETADSNCQDQPHHLDQSNKASNDASENTKKSSEPANDLPSEPSQAAFETVDLESIEVLDQLVEEKKQ